MNRSCSSSACTQDECCELMRCSNNAGVDKVYSSNGFDCTTDWGYQNLDDFDNRICSGAKCTRAECCTLKSCANNNGTNINTSFSINYDSGFECPSSDYYRKTALCSDNLDRGTGDCTIERCCELRTCAHGLHVEYNCTNIQQLTPTVECGTSCSEDECCNGVWDETCANANLCSKFDNYTDLSKS